MSLLSEMEERFMKFLQYIDILDRNDQKKIEGEKLRQKIFSIEKFAAY